MNFTRQRTRNDCAYTCLCILLGKDWTLLKNEMIGLEDFRRSVHMNPKRIPITSANQNKRLTRYHPYSHLMGMTNRQILYTLFQNLKETTKIGPCRMDQLSKSGTYIIILKSLNYHNCYHCVLYHKGRLHDPSKKRRYVYRRDLMIEEALQVFDMQDLSNLTPKKAVDLITFQLKSLESSDVAITSEQQ